MSGTKISLSINGGGTAIVQLEVAKRGTKRYRQVGKLHLAANGETKKTTFRIGRAGKARLRAAAPKGRSFTMRVVVAIYSGRGTAKATEAVTIQG